MSQPRPLHILVADDSASIRQILVTLLSRQGHHVVAAENGEEALQRFNEHQPDLVLLDVVMPLMDGMEVARRIRAQSVDRWIPIIFLSALDRRENLVAGLEAGGDDFLAKPLDFSLLDARIRSLHKALELQRQAQESYRKLKVISDNVLDAIITIDIEGIIRSCNEVTERLFGWEAGTLLGQNVKVLMPEPYHSRHDEHIGRYVNGGQPHIIGSRREVPARRKEGTVFPIELAVTEIDLPEQRIFVGIIRDITERKQAEMEQLRNADALQRYYDRSEEENRLAMRLLDKQMLRPGLTDPAVHYWLMAAKDFSGDVVAAARAPDGSLLALLADATGHGLTAAISTLPLLTVFYGTAGRGLPMAIMLQEMNKHLKAALPTGHFVAAVIVRIDSANGEGEIWSGGMPTAAMLDEDGTVVGTFASGHLPLGILPPDAFDPTTRHFACEAGCQVLLYSDGLKEAENPDGQQLGTEGLLDAVSQTSPHNRLTILQQLLDHHLSGTEAKDDISVMLVDCQDAAPATTVMAAPSAD